MVDANGPYCTMCGTRMKPLFQGWYCVNECDIEPAKRTPRHPKTYTAVPECALDECDFGWDEEPTHPGVPNAYGNVWGTSTNPPCPACKGFNTKQRYPMPAGPVWTHTCGDCKKMFKA